MRSNEDGRAWKRKNLFWLGLPRVMEEVSADRGAIPQVESAAPLQAAPQIEQTPTGDYRAELWRCDLPTTCEGHAAPGESRWRWQVAKNRRRWRRRLPNDLQARILEIGCGDGLFVRFLHEEGFRNAEGFDANAGRIARARRLGLENVFHADLRTYFSECGKTERWDVVFALNVIEHLHKHEILRLLRDVFGALRPGGMFWIRVPNGAGLFGGHTRYIEFTHETAFTTNSLKDMSSYSWGPIPHGPRSLIRFLGWKAVELALTCLALLETASTKGGIFTSDLLAQARKPAGAE